MTVTGITDVSKSRVKIEIDHEFAFVIYKGELRTYGIKENQEIKDADYQEIKEKILPKRARLRAMNLLTKRTYTTYQLADKLRIGGYSEDIIADAIAYVASFGYINDEQYARDFIEYNMEQKSKIRIFNDLQKKSISKDIIQEAWELTVGDSSKKLEIEQIIKLLQKKKFSAETVDYAEKQKIMAFLYRKGFSMETIRNVLSLDITSI